MCGQRRVLVGCVDSVGTDGVWTGVCGGTGVFTREWGQGVCREGMYNPAYGERGLPFKPHQFLVTATWKRSARQPCWMALKPRCVLDFPNFDCFASSRCELYHCSLWEHQSRHPGFGSKFMKSSTPLRRCHQKSKTRV